MMDYDYKQMCISGSVGLTALLTILLAIALCKGSVTQNLATYLLWLSLDLIALATCMIKHGNYAQLMTYTVGNVALSSCIVIGGKLHRPGVKVMEWKGFENFVATMVTMCVIIWVSFVENPNVAHVASVMALNISGLPQVRDNYKDPHSAPLLVYCGYVVASILAVIGGKDWSIPERFYSSCATIYPALVVCIIFYRRTRVEKPRKLLNR